MKAIKSKSVKKSVTKKVKPKVAKKVGPKVVAKKKTGVAKKKVVHKKESPVLKKIKSAVRTVKVAVKAAAKKIVSPKKHTSKTVKSSHAVKPKVRTAENWKRGVHKRRSTTMAA